MDIFIVDDNPSIRKFLMQIIPTLSKKYRVIGVGASVEEGLLSLKMLKPDLLILDVELPDGKGFDILQKLSEQKENGIFEGNVVFVTAHDHYALRAIKYSALDFLVKPVILEELQKALEKAVREKQSKHITQNQTTHFLTKKIETLKQNLKQLETEKLNSLSNPNEQTIVLSDAEKIYLISINEIIRCESQRNYTSFHLTKNRNIVVSQPMKFYENILPKENFYRVHRSHLINLHFFDFLDKREGGTLHLKDGSILPVAIRRKEDLIEKLRKRN